MLAETYKETFSDLLFQDGRPLLEINVEYLGVKGQVTEAFEKTFCRYCERQAQLLNLRARGGIYNDALKACLRAKKQGLPFNAFAVTQTAETTFVSEKYLSVARRISTYTGGAHGYVKMISDVWSLSSARRLTLREVTGLSDAHIRAAEAAKMAIAEDASGKFFPDAERAALRGLDPRDFFLTQRGVSVFYPIYTLAPYYAGIQIFETGMTPR